MADWVCWGARALCLSVLLGCGAQPATGEIASVAPSSPATADGSSQVSADGPDSGVRPPPPGSSEDSGARPGDAVLPSLDDAGPPAVPTSNQADDASVLSAGAPGSDPVAPLPAATPGESAGSGSDSGAPPDDRVDDAGEPAEAAVIVPCQERYPDFDCEFSARVWSRRALVVGERCEECHGDPSAALQFVGYEEASHDAALSLIDMGRLRASTLVSVVAAGHGCWSECADDAQDVLGDLYTWQERIALHEARLKQIDEAEAVWLAAGIDDYEWHIEEECFGCGGLTNALVAVEAGSITALVTGAMYADPSEPTPVSDARPWHTVLGFFDTLRGFADQDPDGLTAQFNAEYAYPTNVYIDERYDWIDDELWFRGDTFMPLSSAYCPFYGPFTPSAAAQQAPPCASSADCAECRPQPVPVRGCDELHAYCSSDADCTAAGAVCEFYGRTGCERPGSYCRLACSEDPCPDGYACMDDGHCVRSDCGELPGLCVDAAHCQPGASRADERGCVTPGCDEVEIDCGPIATCNPTAAAALPNGCAFISCSDDGDCSCGSCVNGSCSPTPGVCLAVTGAPPTPVGPPP